MGSSYYFRKFCWKCCKRTHWAEYIGRSRHDMFCRECTLTYELGDDYHFAMTEDQIYEMTLTWVRSLYIK